jgi:transglutaminase-like putative cysteine protease
VSRRSFRFDVTDPRPSSAWALVTVASATLWITQQLAIWVVVIQVGFLLYTLAVRTNPRAWQRSGIALNIGMFFIVGVTIYVALQGGPSTIALAHFAALTQALQLVDARPRRTEFLLVALALFQVVLASNLTDSVFFPPLLVAFVFATVWTLIVHTLRSEALEASEMNQAVAHVVTPGLVKMTVFATAMSVLLALVLFVLLPRLRSSVVAGADIAPVIATAGFSDRVALGALGSIRQDPTVVMRVETRSGERPPRAAAYWRGLAFDHFDGQSWSITPSTRSPVPGSVEGGVSFGRRPDQFNLVQTIVREPVEAGVLFGVGDRRKLQGTIRRLEADVNGGIYAVGQVFERVRYTVSTQRTEWRDAALRRDRAAAPRFGPERYYQLPELSPAVAELARDITRDAATDADRMRALEEYLLANGRYSDTPPAFDQTRGGSDLENFLFNDMAAHCEYYASALVVLARSVGLPSRLVNGFAGGRRNRIGDFVEVTRSDAHAWVEMHFERAGWVRYDATPAVLRSRAAAPVSLQEQLREFASAMELWWFQRVVGFDRSDQIHTLKRLWLAWRGNQRDRYRAESGTVFTRWKQLSELPWRQGVLPMLCVGAAGATLWRVRPRVRATGLPTAYADALRLLERRGLRRAHTTTAREFAAAVRDALPAASPAFDALTEAYLGERFGGRADPSSRRRLTELRERLSAS